MAVQYVPSVSKTGAFSPDILALNADTLPTNYIDGSPLPVGFKALLTDAPISWKIHTGGGTWSALDNPQSGPAGGDAVTIADGADVAQGAVADAVVAAGAVGTISAKLRRVTQGLEDLKTLIVLAAGTAKIGLIGIETVASATLANVVSSASNVTLLASNSARKGMAIYNDSTQVLYVKMGATASATSYTVQIPANGYWEMPLTGGIYTGIIDGIWAAANGNARVTSW